MKIALLTTSFPEKGHESRGPFIKRLYDHLQEQGIKITLITPKGFHSLKEQGGIFPALSRNPMSIVFFFFYTISFTFLIAFRSRKTDLIHANWSYTALLAILTKFIHRKKILLTERGPEIVYIKNQIIKTIVRFVYNHVDKLVVISSQIAEDIHLLYRIPKEKISIITNGVTVPPLLATKSSLRKKLHIPHTTYTFLSAGRLIKRKGINLIIDALKEVPNAELYIVGDGTELPALQEQVRKSNLEQRVHFVGEVLPKNVFQWMRACDVFVFSSFMETGGNVLLEAVASGMPVITTNVGWARDVVHHKKNGFIIRAHNRADLIKAMNYFTHHPQQLALFSKESKNIIKNRFNWEDCAKNYITLYKKLC